MFAQVKTRHVSSQPCKTSYLCIPIDLRDTFNEAHFTAHFICVDCTNKEYWIASHPIIF